MRLSYSSRVRVGFILLLAFSLLVGFQRTKNALKTRRAVDAHRGERRGEIEAFLARIDPLRRFVEPNVVLGYVTDLELSPVSKGTGDEGREAHPPDSSESEIPGPFRLITPRTEKTESRDQMKVIREFYLTQYALAPALVVHDSSRALLIANFRDRASLEEFVADRRYEVRFDTGNGIGLIQRTDR